MKGADPRVLAEPRSRGVTIHHLLALLVVGTVGLLLNGHALAGWADGLPDSVSALKDAAHWWEDATGRLGLSAPYDAVHRWVRDAVAAPF